MLDVKKQIDVDVKDHESYLTDEGLIEFGNMISEGRVRLQITQKRLSDLSGYSEVKMSNIERANFKGLTHTDARKIAHALRLNVDELLREYKYHGTRKWGASSLMAAAAAKPRTKQHNFTIVQEKSIRINTRLYSLLVKEANGDWSITIQKDNEEKCSIWGNTAEDPILLAALQEACKILSKSL